MQQRSITCPSCAALMCLSLDLNNTIRLPLAIALGYHAGIRLPARRNPPSQELLLTALNFTCLYQIAWKAIRSGIKRETERAAPSRPRQANSLLASAAVSQPPCTSHLLSPSRARRTNRTCATQGLGTIAPRCATSPQQRYACWWHSYLQAGSSSLCVAMAMPSSGRRI